MKYINSIFTPGMNGKLGNTVFSNNQYGPYSCEKRIPVDPKTTAQQDVRAGTAMIARMWAKLTDSQRANWRVVADRYPFQKKGKRYFLTGFTFFMKLNRNLYEVYEPVMEDFPSDSDIKLQVFSSFYVEIVNSPSGKDLLLFIDPAIDSDTKIKISATMPVISSELYGKHKRYKIAVLDNTFVSGSSIKEFYIKKHKKLPGRNIKAFFDMKSTNITSGFSTVPVSSETYGI